MKRKPQLAQLKKNYIFIEVAERVKAFRKKYPEKKLLSLSVGDTTEPLPESVVTELFNKAKALGTKEGYQGYGPEEGFLDLREKIGFHFYKQRFSKEEIFISDGAICDIGRLTAFFGTENTIAIQDPSYPGYKDISLLLGAKEIVMFDCDEKNGFFPDLSQEKNVDLIFFCSPNNPTGYAATFEQLEELVAFAKRSKAFILFDAAYAPFIQDEKIPKSIYDVSGAEDVAIEIHSFSKMIGFTGVRLGWTVVPKQLHYEDGNSVQADWSRFITSVYNGTSVISQAGGLAALSVEGMNDSHKLIDHYMENVALLKNALDKKGYALYGGNNAPYLWVDCKKNSWETFDTFLYEKGLIVMPGIGFGKNGEGFIRLTGFGNRNTILEAITRL